MSQNPVIMLAKSYSPVLESRRGKNVVVHSQLTAILFLAAAMRECINLASQRFRKEDGVVTLDRKEDESDESNKHQVAERYQASNPDDTDFRARADSISSQRGEYGQSGAKH